MNKETYPHTIHTGTLKTLDPYDQAIIMDWCRKGYWELVDSYEKPQINL